VKVNKELNSRIRKEAMAIKLVHNMPKYVCLRAAIIIQVGGISIDNMNVDGEYIDFTVNNNTVISATASDDFDNYYQRSMYCGFDDSLSSLRDGSKCMVYVSFKIIFKLLQERIENNVN